jgi:raffinose/stachyose/melibiose transport system substrate-binding protein
MYRYFFIGAKRKFPMSALILAISLILTLLPVTFLFAGCKSDVSQKESPEIVTLRLFSNLPDRKNGQGLIEQMIVDEFEETHPDIKIEIECLDEEAYKTKFRAYAMDGMPDIVSVWGQPAFLDDIIDAGMLAELPISDYEDYGFEQNSLTGFMKNNKLYGLPRNTDMIAIYYNKRIFREENLTLPTNRNEYVALCKKLSDAGITPVAMDGLDGWPLVEYFDNCLLTVSGEKRTELLTNAIMYADFSHEDFDKALRMLKSDVKKGIFQEDFAYCDYGTAMALFTAEETAMYYMGSWEASMAVNEAIPPKIRDNIGVFTMPGFNPNVKNAMVWFGGGYSISANSKHYAEAKEFIDYMFLPEHLSKYGWENGIGMSAQDQTAFMLGNETTLQKEWLSILDEADIISGTPINDLGSSGFKYAIESNIARAATGEISSDAFFKILEEACR